MYPILKVCDNMYLLDTLKQEGGQATPDLIKASAFCWP